MEAIIILLVIGLIVSFFVIDTRKQRKKEKLEQEEKFYSEMRFKSFLEKSKIESVSHIKVKKKEELRKLKIKEPLYKNHCWRCQFEINSKYQKRCKDCDWFVCSHCNACSQPCTK